MKTIIISVLSITVFALGNVFAQTGKVDDDDIPWSASYYPLYAQALHNGYQPVEPSPLAKYDKYTGQGNASVNWNKYWKYQFWANQNGGSIPGWFGYCHAWCAASILEKEPWSSVFDKDIVFRVGDLKGYLMVLYDSPMSKVHGYAYGKPKWQNGPISYEMDDVTPLAFETILVQHIGGQNGGSKIPVVMDKYNGLQIWNHPIYKYDISKVQINTITGWKKKVACKIWYATEWSDYDRAGTNANSITYYYILEDTDNDNKADKSNWTNSTWTLPSNDHPDFLWIPFGRYPNPIPGKEYYGPNPKVNYYTVKKIIGSPKVALFLKDNPADIGIEPSTGYCWHSPDIWTVPSKLLPGNKVKLMAKVRNESGFNISDATVTFYRSAPNVGSMMIPAAYKLGQVPNVYIGYYQNTDVPINWTVPNTTTNNEGCIGIAAEFPMDPISCYFPPSKDNNVAANNLFELKTSIAADFTDFGFIVPNAESFPLHVVLGLDLVEGPPGWFVELRDIEGNVLTERLLDDPMPLPDPFLEPFFELEVEPEGVSEYYLRIYPLFREIGQSAMIAMPSALISMESGDLVGTNGITLNINLVDEWELGPQLEIFVEPDPLDLYAGGDLVIHFRNRAPITQLEFTLQDEPGVFQDVFAQITERTGQFEVVQTRQENGTYFQLRPLSREAFIQEGEGPILQVEYRLTDQAEVGQQGQFLFDDMAAYNMEYQQLPILFQAGQFQVMQSFGKKAGQKVGADEDDKQSLPGSFALHSNFPNPFNPVTTIAYQLPVASKVILKIYDVLGREVKTLLHGEQKANFHNVVWDGKDANNQLVGSGFYICRLHAIPINNQHKTFHATIKMLFMK